MIICYECGRKIDGSVRWAYGRSYCDRHAPLEAEVEVEDGPGNVRVINRIHRVAHSRSVPTRPQNPPTGRNRV